MVYRPINGKLKVGMRCGEHGKSAVEEAGKTMQHAKRMTRGARIRKFYFPKTIPSLLHFVTSLGYPLLHRCFQIAEDWESDIGGHAGVQYYCAIASQRRH